MTQVQSVMNREFVVAAEDALVRDAERLLAGSHYLALLEREEVIGILCACDLGRMGRGARVGACLRLPVLGIGHDAPVREAATLMHGRGTGCLAVFSGERRLVGLVTRDDLRRAGVPHGMMSDSPVCSACGSDEHVRPQGTLWDVGFCSSCVDGAGAIVSDSETGGEG